MPWVRVRLVLSDVVGGVVRLTRIGGDLPPELDRRAFVEQGHPPGDASPALGRRARVRSLPVQVGLVTRKPTLMQRELFVG
jgi:hypothetical protein